VLKNVILLGFEEKGWIRKVVIVKIHKKIKFNEGWV
jgi:hypothetical protein